MDSTLVYLLLAAGAYLILPRLGVKFPTPTPGPTPSDPSALSGLIDAIVKALLDRFLPAVRQTVRDEIAHRPPVEAVKTPTVERSPDGALIVHP